MAATRLMSMNKTKAPSLLHSMRLNLVSKLFKPGVSATDNFSKPIEEFGRTLGFPISGGGAGGNLNEKLQFESFNPSLFQSTLADRFRVDVRGQPVISDKDEDDDDDEFDDDDDNEFCDFDDDDDDDGGEDDGDDDEEKRKC